MILSVVAKVGILSTVSTTIIALVSFYLGYAIGKLP